MSGMRKLLVASLVMISAVQAAEIKHCFLAKDESRPGLHYVDQFNPANDWDIPLVKGCRDIRLLDNNRVMVSYADGYAEFDLGTQEKVFELHRPEFTKTETVNRLPNGNTVLGMNGKGTAFAEVTPAGDIVCSVTFPKFYGLRLMRFSEEGHLLFGANNDHVIEADWDGTVYADIQVPDAKSIYWVKKLDGGKAYRAVTGYGRSIVDIARDGTVLRVLGGGEEIHSFARPFELPNGNIVASQWGGHKPQDSKNGPQLIEYDPHGNVVWTWHDAKRAGTIHGVIILK